MPSEDVRTVSKTRIGESAFVPLSVRSDCESIVETNISVFIPDGFSNLGGGFGLSWSGVWFVLAWFVSIFQSTLECAQPELSDLTLTAWHGDCVTLVFSNLRHSEIILHHESIDRRT